LKKEGSLWLNIGDTYGGSCQGGGDTGLSKERHRKELLTYTNKPQRKLMPKCLLMIPERLAWSLIQNGWILRNKIIWYKPNSMPSSVKDRLSNRWEGLFLFVKSSKPVYWTNRKTGKLVTKQPLGTKGIEEIDWEWRNIEGSWQRPNRDEIFKIPSRQKSTYATAKLKKVSLWTAHDYYFDLDAVREAYTDSTHERMKYPINKIPRAWTDEKATPMSGGKTPNFNISDVGKNPGDVFEINTQPFPKAHFAVFPEKLCEKPIKVGCPEQ
ncbi:unnamed protein product, partial [marine sediment metagenome]